MPKLMRRPLTSVPPVPLYYQLKEQIKQRIAANKLAVGAALPTEIALMAEYGVSRITVVKALSELSHEGILQRRQGKGTFVARPGSPLAACDVVGFIMPTDERHLYGPMLHGMITGLVGQPYFCLVQAPGPNPAFHDEFRRLIGKHPAKLVIDGGYGFPFAALADFTGDLIFVLRFEENAAIAADYILADYHEGGRLAAEHILRRGYRRLIFFTPRPTLPPKVRSPRIPHGIRQAFRENDLPETNMVTAYHGGGENGIIRAAEEFLSRESQPVAVFAEGDFRAAGVYHAARKLGRKIPEDVAVIGFFNTPWCSMLEPQLTSVSLREDEIARLTVEKIIRGGPKERLMVKPKLVVRQSC